MRLIEITCSTIARINWLDGKKQLGLDDEVSTPSVWCVFVPNGLKLCGRPASGLLSLDEVNRSKRFYQSGQSDRFIVGHTILRILLGKLLHCSPQDVPIEAEYGHKPVLKDNAGKTIAFNLTYSNDYVLIAIDRQYGIGVDIEKIDAGFSFEPLLNACFSEKEINYIQGGKDEEQHARFFLLWTRKEALLKKTGEGLNDNLSAIELLDGTNLVDGRNFEAGNATGALVNTFLAAPGYIACVASDRKADQYSFYKI